MNKSYYEIMAGIEASERQSEFEEANESLLEQKIKRLDQKKAEKEQKLGINKPTYESPILAKTSGKAWYDADSPYQTGGIQDSSDSRTLRLGDIDSTKYNYANAPEAPGTIEWKYNRKATPEEVAAYNASMMAKDNFAMGTTPASKESFQDIIDNPLTPENQALYNQAMQDVYKRVGNTIDLKGTEGKEGIKGRQIVQAYNPTAPDPTESLQNRLLQTGNAVMMNQGVAKADGAGKGSLDAVDAMLEKEAREDYGIVDEAMQTVAGGASGILKGGVELADAAQELATYPIQALYNKVTGEKVDIDLIPEEFKKDVREGLDDLVGYDAKLDEETIQQVEKEFKSIGVDITDPSTYSKLLETKNVDKLSDIAIALITNPSLTAGMITEVIGSGAALGAGVKVASKIGSKVAPKLSNKIDNVLKSEKTKSAEKVAAAKAAGIAGKELDNVVKLAEKEYNAGKKLKDLLKGSVYTNADMATRVNNDIEAYKKNNNGEDPSITKIASIVGLNRIASSAEVGSMKLAFDVSGKLTQAVKDGVLKAATKQFAHVGKSVGTEMVQEGFDTVVETINQEYDSAKYKDKTVADLISDASAKILTGVAAGGAGGGHMAGSKVALDQVKKVSPKAVLDAGKRKVEKMTETEEQRIVRENSEYSAPLKAEASAKMATNDTDSVVGLVDDIHGKISKDLDASAPKEYTYGIVIRDALNKAHESEDMNAVKNIYKTIAELDSRKDIDFKAETVIGDRAHKATQQFLDIINSSGESAVDKMNALKTAKDTAKEAGETVKTSGASIDKNIIAKVQAMKARIEQEKAELKDVMGSEQYEVLTKDFDNLTTTMEDYLKGKTVEDVNTEMSELGFIEKDSSGQLKADPSRPGIKRYAKELGDQLLNPKTNKNLLNKKVTGAGGVTLAGLGKFAKSRVEKLATGTREYAYQTSKLINTLIPENSQILDTIKELQSKVDGLKGLDADTKADYKEVLDEAYDNVQKANDTLNRRKEILANAGELKAAGSYAYQIDKDGKETLQIVIGKDRKEVATIAEDGTIQWIAGNKQESESKVESEVEPKVEQKVEVKKPIENGSSIIDKTPNKEDYYASGDSTKAEITGEPTAEPKEEPKTAKPATLQDVRNKIAKLNDELHKELDAVDDMQMKAHVKAHYKKKLAELQGEKTKLEGIIDRMMNEMESKTGTKKLGKLKKMADALIKGMVKFLNVLKKRLKLTNKQHKAINTELNELLTMINEIEGDYEAEVIKTSIGTVKKYKDSIHGPMIESGEKRFPAKLNKKGMVSAGKAMESLRDDKLKELDEDIKENNSLGSRIATRLLNNFHPTSTIHKILQKSNDSIFGKMDADMFANEKELLDNLPQSFKDFFIIDDDGAELIDNFKTMDKFTKGMKLGEINIGKNRVKGNMDANGLIMDPTEQYEEIDRPIVVGDKLGHKTAKNPKTGYRATIEIKSEKDIPADLGDYKVKSTTGDSFPVGIVELIGTVNDKGVLEIDPQTETILKFYAAKMVVDSQAMVGNILSMDAADMQKYLGITDANEQKEVKANALDGWVGSASVRKDIGSEVYRALGIKFNNTTPEFTEESFKSTLGGLVQAMAINDGVMDTQKSKYGNKSQNLVRINSDKIAEALGEDSHESLIKAMNKLQYLNEARNRPLPSKKPLKAKKDGERFVMNTKTKIDSETNDKMNKTEETQYRISKRLEKYLKMDEDKVLQAMGYKSLDDSGLHISEMSAQQARNDKLVREWDILKTFAKATGSSGFYIPWGQTVSGRYTMLSDIQYQESKLHREFVVATGSTETVDVKDADVQEQLKASILQGLDMDPDKLSPETANERFDETFEVTDKGIEVNSKLNKKFEGKVILANAGTGKSYVAKGIDNVVDGDKLLVDAVNQVLKKQPTHEKINTVAVLNDVWLSWGKGSKDPKTLEKYNTLRNSVYEIQAEMAKNSADKGNTVLIASSRPAILDIVDTIVYQGDTNTLIKSRSSKDRENVLIMSAEEVETKNAKFLNSIKGKEDKVIRLKPSQFLGDVLLKNNSIKTAYEAMRNGKLAVSAMAEVFDDSEGHHGISSIELLADWDKAIKSGEKLTTHANVEIDAITSGMILTLLQIGTDAAIKMAEKGGIYTADRMPVLKKYVEHWLPGKTFTPGALIEAGKAHAAVIEAGDKATKEQKEMLKGQETDLQSDEVFKDLYSTIGVAMIKEVQDYKNMLKNKEKRDADEELQLAMLEEIGELNLKNIRSIAKSPVMVYIYGASILSIKNKLTYSLGMDTLVKAIKKGNEKFVNMFIPQKQYKDMYGNSIAPEELENMTDAQKLLYLDIPDKTVDKIGEVINATFGTAIEIAFDSKLGFVDRNRDAVKAVEMLTFEAYRIKLAERIKDKLDSVYGEGKHKGELYKISKADLVSINNSLTDEGYGHTILWKEDGRKDRNQTLQKTTTKGGSHSSSVTVGENTPVRGQIKGSMAEANTGAASTIPIHAIDGDMILETLNRELTGKLAGKYTGGNVYDAVVLSVNKEMLEDTADYYNTGMIDTGFGRSIMADQLYKLETMLQGLTDEGMIDQFTNGIGLRPEGEGASAYAKEAMRLKLSIGKMLQRIELAEGLNSERLANSQKGYGSGHLYQMGSGVVEIDKSTESRAKEFPAIARLKELLNQVIEDDRTQTAKDFGGKLAKDVDYVLNLNDLVVGKNNTKSKGNLAQFRVEQVKEKGKVKFKLKVEDKMWVTVTDRDTVQLAKYKIDDIREQLKAPKHGKSAIWHLDNTLKELGKSEARIVDEANDWSWSGRVKENGVWVKKPTEVKELKDGDKVKVFSEFVITSGPLKDKHITYHFNPENHANRKGPDELVTEGTEVDAYIVGKYSDDKMTYYTIELEIDGKRIKTQQDGKRPLHITAKTAEGVKPFETGVHAENNPDKIKKVKEQKLETKASVHKGTYNSKYDKSKPVEATKYRVDKGYKNHSGGAIGSDTIWGNIGEEYGVTSNHYYVDKTPNGNIKITEEERAEGIEKAKQAAKDLGKYWSGKPYIQGLLARNWQQVKNADAVYAIAEIDGKYVKGGTGYAVAMAVREGKPVYVFDKSKNNWFKREADKWVKIDTPALTNNFAGIGSREVNDKVNKAIKEVYEKTFTKPKTENRRMNTREFLKEYVLDTRDSRHSASTEATRVFKNKFKELTGKGSVQTALLKKIADGGVIAKHNKREGSVDNSVAVAVYEAAQYTMDQMEQNVPGMEGQFNVEKDTMQKKEIVRELANKLKEFTKGKKMPAVDAILNNIKDC